MLTVTAYPNAGREETSDACTGDRRRRAAGAAAIATGLRQEKMAVDVALDGLSGLERAQCTVTGYDVIILDRDLPGLHGDKVCARLGADDYLPKPFAFTEL